MNHLITPDTRLSDIIVEAPSTLAILSRFGVRLGVGDATVASASRQLNVDPILMVTILNTSLYDDYDPSAWLPHMAVADVKHYLNFTRAYHEHYQLPNIEHHFQLLLGKSSSSNLQPMLQFFHQVQQQMLATSDYSNADDLDDKINDLMSMIAIHLQGDYDANLAHAVLHAIGSLRTSLAQSHRIVSRILQPLRRSSESPLPSKP